MLEELTVETANGDGQKQDRSAGTGRKAGTRQAHKLVLEGHSI